MTPTDADLSWQRAWSLGLSCRSLFPYLLPSGLGLLSHLTFLSGSCVTSSIRLGTHHSTKCLTPPLPIFIGLILETSQCPAKCEGWEEPRCCPWDVFRKTTYIGQNLEKTSDWSKLRSPVWTAEESEGVGLELAFQGGVKLRSAKEKRNGPSRLGNNRNTAWRWGVKIFIYVIFISFHLEVEATSRMLIQYYSKTRKGKNEHWYIILC